MKRLQQLLSISIAVLGLAGCPDDDPPPADETGIGTETFSTTDETCGTACMSANDDDSTTSTGVVDTTAGSDDATTGSTSEDECLATSECAGEFCVAPFDATLGVFGKGAFACVAECVPGEEDPRYEEMWCADAEACCNPDAECTDRGYCEVPGADDTGGDDTTDGMDTTDGDDTTGGDTGTTGDTDGTSTGGSGG